MANQPATKKSNRTTSANPGLTVLKKSTCTNLTATETISYEIAINAKGAIFLRLASSTGNGYYSRIRISLTTLLDTLEAWTEKHPVTALALKDAYPPHTSINSAGSWLQYCCHSDCWSVLITSGIYSYVIPNHSWLRLKS